jgi:PTS system nitrogen regulatory IIA component
MKGDEAKQGAVMVRDYVSLNRMIFCTGATKVDVIDELIRVSKEDGMVRDTLAFKEALIHREQIMSTGIGYGVAIPHVKLRGLEEFFVTVGIHKRGVDWDALDAQPAHLIFLIAGPDHVQEKYLRILARLTLVIKDPVRRNRLIGFNTRFEAYELLMKF